MHRDALWDTWMVTGGFWEGVPGHVCKPTLRLCSESGALSAISHVYSLLVCQPTLNSISDIILHHIDRRTKGNMGKGKPLTGHCRGSAVCVYTQVPFWHVYIVSWGCMLLTGMGRDGRRGWGDNAHVIPQLSTFSTKGHALSNTLKVDNVLTCHYNCVSEYFTQKIDTILKNRSKLKFDTNPHKLKLGD